MGAPTRSGLYPSMGSRPPNLTMPGPLSTPKACSPCAAAPTLPEADHLPMGAPLSPGPGIGFRVEICRPGLAASTPERDGLLQRVAKPDLAYSGRKCSL